MGRYVLPVMILLPLVAGGIGYWIGTKNKKLRDRFTAIVTVFSTNKRYGNQRIEKLQINQRVGENCNVA